MARCNTAFAHTLDDWSLQDWMCALAGEVGEAANLVKKMRRGDFGVVDLYSDGSFEHSDGSEPAEEDGTALRAELAKELADCMCYLDLVAARAGIDLEEAVREKFNEVSERVGSKVKLNV